MNQPELPFALTSSERNSALWLRLDRYWKDRLDRLRAQNDGDKSDIETANLRGRIAELKTIVALGREQNVPESAPPAV
jgi:hypothetical protein